MIVEAVRVGCENSLLPLDSTLNLSEQYPVTPDDQGKGAEGHVVLSTAAEVLMTCAWVNSRLVGSRLANGVPRRIWRMQLDGSGRRHSVPKASGLEGLTLLVL
jgi:hypothetical protein